MSLLSTPTCEHYSVEWEAETPTCRDRACMARWTVRYGLLFASTLVSLVVLLAIWPGVSRWFAGGVAVAPLFVVCAIAHTVEYRAGTPGRQ